MLCRHWSASTPEASAIWTRRSVRKVSSCKARGGPTVEVPENAWAARRRGRAADDRGDSEDAGARRVDEEHAARGAAVLLRELGLDAERERELRLARAGVAEDFGDRADLNPPA